MLLVYGGIRYVQHSRRDGASTFISPQVRNRYKKRQHPDIPVSSPNPGNAIVSANILRRCVKYLRVVKKYSAHPTSSTAQRWVLWYMFSFCARACGSECGGLGVDRCPVVVLVARKPWAPHGERCRPTLQEGGEASRTEQCQEVGRADNTRTICGRASRGRSARATCTRCLGCGSTASSRRRNCCCRVASLEEDATGRRGRGTGRGGRRGRRAGSSSACAGGD